MAPHFRRTAEDSDELDDFAGAGPVSSSGTTAGRGTDRVDVPKPPEPLRRNASYQLLWLGSAASALGTGASSIAFPLLILAMTGSSALAGVSAAASTAAMVLAGLPAGALADRWDRRRALISVESVRTINGLVLVWAIVGGWITLTHIIIAAVVQGAGGALLMPCRNAAIRDVVHRDQLHSAFAQEEARSHVADIGGPRWAPPPTASAGSCRSSSMRCRTWSHWSASSPPGSLAATPGRPGTGRPHCARTSGKAWPTSGTTGRSER